jgi:hypothetical protein
LKLLFEATDPIGVVIETIGLYLAGLYLAGLKSNGQVQALLRNVNASTRHREEQAW